MDQTLISYRYPRRKLFFVSLCFLALAALAYPDGFLREILADEWGPLLGDLGVWSTFLICLSWSVFCFSRLFIKKSTIVLADDHLIAPEKPGTKPRKIFFSAIRDYRIVTNKDVPSLFTLEITHSDGTLIINSPWLESDESAQTIIERIKRYRIGRKAELTRHQQTPGATQKVHAEQAYNQKIIDKLQQIQLARPLTQVEQQHLQELKHALKENQQLLYPYIDDTSRSYDRLPSNLDPEIQQTIKTIQEQIKTLESAARTGALTEDGQRLLDLLKQEEQLVCELLQMPDELDRKIAQITNRHF